MSTSPATTSSHLTPAPSRITRQQREQQNQHKAAVLWFTGLSGAGKTTLAQALEQALFELNCHTFYVDGDYLRHNLNRDLGFSPQDRSQNIRRAADIAKLAYEHGHIVLCTFISPLATDRAQARAAVPEGAFIEIYVKCDLAVLKQRDPKGLYAKALRGEIAQFTGISAPYEAPTHVEFVAETDHANVETLVTQLLALLRTRQII